MGEVAASNTFEFIFKEIDMFARVVLSMLFATAPLHVQAATESVALSGSNNPDTTFVSRATADSDSPYVDVRVMRDFADTTTLGNDPVTGASMYPHRSVTLNYKVDCSANRLAVSGWQMFAGNLASGQVVWKQKNTGRLGFIDAVNAEMRAVMQSACPTSTASR